MYYTALNTEGRGVKDQRIGLAESDDLMTWRRVASEPLVEPDPCHYRMVADGSSETWRDPFVFRAGDGWHMLITARDPTAERLFDGVLAHARSTDMRTWELAPPLTEPARFGQLEVAQVRCLDGQWLLLFTCHPDEQGERAAVLHLVRARRLAARPVGHRERASRSRTSRTCSPRRSSSAATARGRSWASSTARRFEIVDPIPVELTGGRLRRSAPGP